MVISIGDHRTLNKFRKIQFTFYRKLSPDISPLGILDLLNTLDSA